MPNKSLTQNFTELKARNDFGATSYQIF